MTPQARRMFERIVEESSISFSERLPKTVQDLEAAGLLQVHEQISGLQWVASAKLHAWELYSAWLDAGETGRRKANRDPDAPPPRGLWHGSAVELKVGTVLRPRPGRYALGADPALEALFERTRPEGCTPRPEAVFCVADPGEIDAAGGYVDHIVRIEPGTDAPLRRHDLSWYSHAQGLLDEGDMDAAERAAAAYWDGVPWPDPESSLFEYLARSGTVVAILDLDDEPEPMPAFR